MRTPRITEKADPLSARTRVARNRGLARGRASGVLAPLFHFALRFVPLLRFQ